MKKFYECDCTDNDHTIQVWTDPEFDEVIISTQLAPLHPWYKRVWVAVKYVFNPHGGNYSHWHDTILNPDSTRELRDQLDAFLAEQYNLKADAVVNEQLKNYPFFASIIEAPEVKVKREGNNLSG